MFKKTQKDSAIQYLVFPLLFLCVTSALLFLILKPVVEPYLNLASYLYVDSPHPQSADLFTGISEKVAKNGTIPKSEIRFPESGDLYGEISIKGTSVSAPLYYGDNPWELNRGAGTFEADSGVGIPGENKTVMIAGHCSTFFNGLQDVEVGDSITVETHYGYYVYRVTEMKVFDYRDSRAYDFSLNNENLILYTCYPFTALGFVPERYFVYGKFESGPIIDKTR